MKSESFILFSTYTFKIRTKLTQGFEELLNFRPEVVPEHDQDLDERVDDSAEHFDGLIVGFFVLEGAFEEAKADVKQLFGVGRSLQLFAGS